MVEPCTGKEVVEDDQLADVLHPGCGQEVGQPGDGVRFQTVLLELDEPENIIRWGVPGVVEREVNNKFPATVVGGECSGRKCVLVTDVAEDDINLTLLPTPHVG